MKNIFALAVVLSLCYGCSRSTTIDSDEGKVTVTEKGDQAAVEIETKEGKAKIAASEGGVALPDNFPKDVPIYSGATVKATYTAGEAMVVVLKTGATIADATKFYQDELKSNGWTIQATMNLGEGSMLQATKGERQCTITTGKDEDQTAISISVSPEK
jgi:hypothetical protein